MAIKINGKDLAKRIINWQEVEKVMLNWAEIRPNSTPPVFNDYLCFTANQSNSTLKLTYGSSSGYHSMPHYFEISDDGVYWVDYNPNRLWGWVTITLNNVWDKVYIRNKSETPVNFGSLPYMYKFEMSGSIAASWNISSLLCSSGSTIIPWGYFRQLFQQCTALTSAPKLPFTALTSYCYQSMFSGCTNLATLPALPATTFANRAYYGMFSGCWNIKLSETQTWDYQTEYRIPSAWTGDESGATNPFTNMFSGTWWTFTGTPTINTTYYTSNTIIS